MYVTIIKLNEKLIKDSILNDVAPIHKGAEKFYKEIGIIKD